jgi:hypothetical protein
MDKTACLPCRQAGADKADNIVHYRSYLIKLIRVHSLVTPCYVIARNTVLSGSSTELKVLWMHLVKRDDQIEGLTYLLTLGVRVLTLLLTYNSRSDELYPSPFGRGGTGGEGTIMAIFFFAGCILVMIVSFPFVVH